MDVSKNEIASATLASAANAAACSAVTASWPTYNAAVDANELTYSQAGGIPAYRVAAKNVNHAANVAHDACWDALGTCAAAAKNASKGLLVNVGLGVGTERFFVPVQNADAQVGIELKQAWSLAFTAFEQERQAWQNAVAQERSNEGLAAASRSTCSSHWNEASNLWSRARCCFYTGDNHDRFLLSQDELHILKNVCNQANAAKTAAMSVVVNPTIKEAWKATQEAEAAFQVLKTAREKAYNELR